MHSHQIEWTSIQASLPIILLSSIHSQTRHVNTDRMSSSQTEVISIGVSLFIISIHPIHSSIEMNHTQNWNSHHSILPFRSLPRHILNLTHIIIREGITTHLQFSQPLTVLQSESTVCIITPIILMLRETPLSNRFNPISLTSSTHSKHLSPTSSNRNSGMKDKSNTLHSLPFHPFSITTNSLI